jgi:hypothetical protein
MEELPEPSFTFLSYELTKTREDVDECAVWMANANVPSL